MLISLCIPTNGVVEWISQVIDSIYAQDVPLEKFEVVIVDNGNNQQFYDYIYEKMQQYSNIRYKRIVCPIFKNEIETYKMAMGDFIKFVNHRTILFDGTLKKWIDFMEKNSKSKPIVYFANGELNKPYSIFEYNDFDGFIGDLSYFSSWSTGMAIWKDDMKDLKTEEINELFPHTSILFKNRTDRKYIVDNQIYLQEVPHTSKKKGQYDLFYAFAVEYPSLLLELYKKKSIRIETFLKLKEDNLDFIIDNYRMFCEDGNECSYDLSGYENNIQVFYSNDMVKKRIYWNEECFKKELRRRIEQSNNSNNYKIVFGAGMTGKKFIIDNGDRDVICFVDNNKYKQGKMVMGIPVISYEEFYEKNMDAILIICIKKEQFCDEEIKIKALEKDYIYWRSD